MAEPDVVPLDRHNMLLMRAEASNAFGKARNMGFDDSQDLKDRQSSKNQGTIGRPYSGRIFSRQTGECTRLVKSRSTTWTPILLTLPEFMPESDQDY
jgi:hypothetical protein